MQIQCRKCEAVYVIDETKRTKLKKLDCPNCWEEYYGNWTIIWENKRPIHKIEELIKLSKVEE